MLRVGADVRARQNIEAYVVLAVGIILAVLGLVEQASVELLLTGVLCGMSFLVFNTTRQVRTPADGPELQGREAFGSFQEVVQKAQEIWIYGPTAANILGGAADIRRHLLERGGSARFLVQDPASPSIAATVFQLDDNIDFRQALQVSLGTLQRLQRTTGGGLTYRLLPINPGFSLVVVDPSAADGYVVLELHGYRDENIADRMHVVIRRRESPRWFAYWVSRYEAMWSSASAPADDPPTPAELSEAPPTPTPGGQTDADGRARSLGSPLRSPDQEVGGS